MKLRLPGTLIGVWFVLLLSACGGGSGGEEGTSLTASANAAPSADAGPAQAILAGATVTLDGNASTDPEGQSITYEWVLTVRPPGSAATLAAATDPHPTFVADVAGDYVATLKVSDGALSSTLATVPIHATSPADLKIVASAAEPLADTVQFSLSANTGTAPVTWFLDLRGLESGPVIPYQTKFATNGEHLLLARIETSPGVFTEVRRTITIENSLVYLRLDGATSRFVSFDAGSPLGIVKVSASLDGMVVKSLDVPNSCAQRDCSAPPYHDHYFFEFDDSALAAGEHVWEVVATDSSGHTARQSAGFTVIKPPSLSLASPLDGAFAHGKLRVSGHFGTDKAGPVVILVQLGDVLVFRFTERDFSGEYDLTGLPVGTYALVVNATDSTGGQVETRLSIRVASDDALTYAPLFALGEIGAMVAADGESLLFRSGGRYLLRNFATNEEVVLQNDPDGESYFSPSMSGGVVYNIVRPRIGSTAPDWVDVWNAGGVPRNISGSDPLLQGRSAGFAYGRGRYMAWIYTALSAAPDGNIGAVFDSQTGSYQPIVPPSPDAFAPSASWNYTITGLTSIDAVPTLLTELLTWEQSTYKLRAYRWSLGSNAQVPLSTGQSSGAVSDDNRIAWLQASTPDGRPDSLVVQSVSGGPITTVSKVLPSEYQLHDGVLVWVEAATGFIRASTTSANSIVSSEPKSRLYGAGAGFVVYGVAGKTYLWNSATATSKLIIDFEPRTSLVGGDNFYFTLGSDVMLYRAKLRSD